jgi:dynein heavy chain, axonemal
MFAVPQPSDESIHCIMASILHGFLTNFSTEVQALCRPLVTASIDAYSQITQELLPTPAKSHYTFNLRDVSKVFAGMLMVKPQHCRDKVSIVKLWMHELLRVFHDRLTDASDQDYLQRLTIDLAERHCAIGLTIEETIGRCDTTLQSAAHSSQ